MKLSVIMVSYNEKEYLAEAIESCLKQKCDFPFEIIIGDDGSNDGSIDMLEHYQRRYPEIIRYFVMDRSDVVNVIPAIRASNVLKRGFQEAHGEYFAILSADDLLSDDKKFSKQVEFLENHPGYFSCYTDYKLFWNDGSEQPMVRNDNFSRPVLWARHYVHISCFIFKRTVVNYLLERFCDDTGLLFSILKAGKTRHIPMISFAYRQRDGSIMAGADRLERMIMELALYQDIVNAGGLTDSSRYKFHGPAEYVFENRAGLKEEKYHKYLQNCAKYENNFLGRLASYDQLPEEEQKTVEKWVRSMGNASFRLRCMNKSEKTVWAVIRKLKA